MHSASTTLQRKLTAGLLLAGALVFWAGAFTPPFEWWTGVAMERYLALIFDHRAVWLWIASSFAVGVALTVAGLVMLRRLVASVHRLWADVGFTAFLAGAVLWLCSIAFRATVTTGASDLFHATGEVPPLYPSLRAWADVLFGAYMVLAYLAFAAFGVALASGAVVSRRIARFTLWFGVVGTIGFLARVIVFEPPLMIHVAPSVLAIGLLRSVPASPPS